MSDEVHLYRSIQEEHVDPIPAALLVVSLSIESLDSSVSDLNATLIQIRQVLQDIRTTLEN